MSVFGQFVVQVSSLYSAIVYSLLISVCTLKVSTVGEVVIANCNAYF